MLWNLVYRHQRVADALLVVVVGVLAVGEAASHVSLQTAVSLGVLESLPLLARRRHPVPVLTLVLVATVAAELITHRTTGQFPATLAVYTVAAERGRDVSVPACGVALLVVFVPLPGFVQWGPPVPVVAAWVLGDTLRTRRAQLREEQEASVRRAAAEEQARIARELHDVIAHNVSVMVVQAAAANDVFDTHPEKARDALRSIEATGRSALTELRRLLGAVRAPAEAAYAPQPGLARLDGLVEGVRAAGLPVAVHVEGGLADLPAGLDLSAYRIVQEALTNTLKHAAASRVEVGVRRTAEGLELEIVDDGVGDDSGAGGGQGLIGMRERASLVGGEVDAGPLPGGGFRVRARLPL